MLRYATAIIIALFAFCGTTNAQKIAVYGQIIDAQDSSQLSFAHIIVNNEFALVAQNDGSFTLKALPGDTLKVTFTGYRPYHYRVPDTAVTSLSVTLPMEVDSIYLDEVEIGALPPPHLFKTVFKNSGDKGEPEKEPVEFAGLKTYDGPPKQPKPNILNPVSLLFNKLNKKTRQSRKMKKARKKLGNEGFNPMEDL